MTLITLKGGAQVSMRPQDISAELQKFEELKKATRQIRKILENCYVLENYYGISIENMLHLNEIFANSEIELMTRS